MGVFLRRAAAVSGAAFFVPLALFAASCGGSSTSSVAPAPAPQTHSATISLSQSNSVTLPSINGISSSIALPANDAPAGSTLTVSVSVNPPPNAPSVSAPSANAFEYFTLTASADVTFNGFPKIALMLPAAPVSQGQFYAWMYDSSAARWTDLGTMTVSGASLSFGGGSAAVRFSKDVAYVAIPFTAQPHAACPTPSPKVYVENRGTKTITLYDEQGNEQPLPSGAFPNVVGAGSDENIAFDPSNQMLYVTFDDNGSTSSVHVYDRSGRQIAVSGSFPGLLTPIGIAVDTFNHELYVPDHANNTVHVFDEQGNAVATSGTFPGLSNSDSIAFDPLNRRLYVGTRVLGEAELSTINVYDEDGNPIPASGTFPNLFIPEGIAFDAVNRLLYVTNNARSMINVYDESGNFISAFGPTHSPPLGIALDSSNRQLYVTECCVPPEIEVFDESGTHVSTTGSFPNISNPFGILVVP
jgi:DNA-binding beta-propeller fold protein YncE